MIKNIVTETSEITVELDLVIVNEGSYFVAYCPALELSVNSPTVDNVKSIFDEEAKTFLSESSKRGSLERFLLKNGWRLQQFPILKYEPPRLNKNSLFHLLKSNESIMPISVTIKIE